MKYTILAITHGFILKVSDEFWDLKNAQKSAHRLHRELGDAVINVQIKATDEHHVETIGVSALP